MFNNIRFSCFTILTAALLLQSCKSENTTPGDNRKGYIIPDSLLKTISFATVKTSQLENAITLVGMVDFNQDKQVNIFPLISGNIQDIKVQLGDYVTAGQTLAIVKSSEMAGYSNNLIIAETNVTATKKQLDAFNAASAQMDLDFVGLAARHV